MGHRFPENMKPFIMGICYLCMDKCKEDAILHQHCAFSHWEEKVKRIKEASSKDERL